MTDKVEVVKKACAMCEAHNGSGCTQMYSPDPTHWICKAWLAKAEKAQPEILSQIREYVEPFIATVGAYGKKRHREEDDIDILSRQLEAYFHQQQEKVVREIESHKKVGALGDEYVYLGFWYQLLKADILKGGK